MAVNLGGFVKSKVIDLGDKYQPKLRGRKDFITHNTDDSITISMPDYLGMFEGNMVVPEKILRIFDWGIKNRRVIFDYTGTNKASHQAMAVVIMYQMHLRVNGCKVENIFRPRARNGRSNIERLWRKMGLSDWETVLSDRNSEFGCRMDHPIYAVRDYDDFNVIIGKIGSHLHSYDISYAKTFRHIITELTYNAIEHGWRNININDVDSRMPALFSYYHVKTSNEIHVIICDTGIGIKAHLRQFLPDLETDSEAILKSLMPKISGTFGIPKSYGGKNNAGYGLHLSSELIRNLRADMYIVSGNGCVHISPSDTTSRSMLLEWPGTMVFFKIKIDSSIKINADEILDKIRQNALDEIRGRKLQNDDSQKYFSMSNYFGEYAENKAEAIKFREKHLMPALREGKNVKLDFSEVKSSPHSFLNAMLADAVALLGESCFRRIKIINAEPDIRDAIDYIFEDNLT